MFLKVAAICGLSLGVSLIGGFSAQAKSLPFEGGYYVPVEQAKSCRDANFASYDWTVGFNKAKRTYGDSEGLCKIQAIKFSNGVYDTTWSCNSMGETSAVSLKITTDGEHGKVTALDGKPYAYCGPIK